MLVLHSSTNSFVTISPTPPPLGGYFQKNWVGVCGTLPKTFTLFQTKICDFPCPISDLIKNVIRYFLRSDQC